MTDTPSTELAVHDASNVLALPEEDEWGDVDTGFIGAEGKKPELAPVVPLLVFNANKGFGFTDELTGQTFGEGDTVRAVWLAWSESRAYWKDDFGKGDSQAPTCRSTDMLVPDKGSIEKQSDTCASCPLSRWTADGAPGCGVRYNVMLYLLDERRITRTAFRGIAIKHVQRFLGGFTTRLPQRPPMANVTEITVVAEETNFGPKLVPQLRIGESLTRDEAAPLIALRNDLMRQWQAASADDLASSGREETGGNRAGPDPFNNDNNVVDAEVIDGDVDDAVAAHNDAVGGDELPPEEDF